AYRQTRSHVNSQASRSTSVKYKPTKYTTKLAKNGTGLGDSSVIVAATYRPKNTSLKRNPAIISDVTTCGSRLYVRSANIHEPVVMTSGALIPSSTATLVRPSSHTPTISH